MRYAVDRPFASQERLEGAQVVREAALSGDAIHASSRMPARPVRRSTGSCAATASPWSPSARHAVARDVFVSLIESEDGRQPEKTRHSVFSFVGCSRSSEGNYPHPPRSAQPRDGVSDALICSWCSATPSHGHQQSDSLVYARQERGVAGLLSGALSRMRLLTRGRRGGRHATWTSNRARAAHSRSYTSPFARDSIRASAPGADHRGRIGREHGHCGAGVRRGGHQPVRRSAPRRRNRARRRSPARVWNNPELKSRWFISPGLIAVIMASSPRC